jgi:hypothetical protein
MLAVDPPRKSLTSPRMCAMNKPGFLLLCVIMVALACFLTYRHIVMARALLQDWADASSYKILHARRAFFLPWGMWLGTSRYQVVYHVAIYDPSIKRVRSAWLRLGTYWTGSMDGDAIEVKWEHEDRAGSAHGS